MSNLIKPLTSSVRLYLCGGTGVNIGAALFQPKTAPKMEDDAGFANLNFTYIDTSRSNANAHRGESFYLIEGDASTPIDGAGKVRSVVYKAAARAVPDILSRHPPEDLNIVIHSGSGGSGSIVAPLLVAELLSQSKDVVVIMIGSTTCEKEISNTIDTINSYQGVSQTQKKPVVAIYLENSREKPMSVNNALTHVNTLLLAAVWSGENHGLDRQDLDHFLYYDKVTGYKPGLTGLGINSADAAIDLPKGQVVSGMITLVREGQDPDPGVMVGYHSFGTMSPSASTAIQIKSPIHLHTIQGYFTDIVAGLKTKLAEVRESYRTNPVSDLSIDGLTMEDNGIVL